MANSQFQWVQLPLEIQRMIIEELVLDAIYEDGTLDRFKQIRCRQSFPAIEGLVYSSSAMASQIQHHLWAPAEKLWAEDGVLSDEIWGFKRADRTKVVVRTALLSYLESCAQAVHGRLLPYGKVTWPPHLWCCQSVIREALSEDDDGTLSYNEASYLQDFVETHVAESRP